MKFRFRHAIGTPAATLITAAVMAIVSLGLWSPAPRTGNWLVRASYDWSQRWLAPASLTNAPVAIVYLDLESYLREQQNPSAPWSRQLHAALVRRLTAAGARAVIFDIIFSQADALAPADAEFAAALRRDGHVVLAAELEPSSRELPQVAGVRTLALALPANLFLAAAATCGVANASVDDDFMVRRQFRGSPAETTPSLAWAAAQLLGQAPAHSSSWRWLRYYGAPLTLPHVSYSAALRPEEVGDDFFRGKAVFVGARPMAGTFLERKDEFRNPLTSWGDRDLFMPAVEVHATQLLNLLRDDSLGRLSAGAEALILLCAAVLLAVLLFRFRPLAAAGVAAAGGGAVVAAAALALSGAHLWFPWLLIAAVQIPGALAGSVLWQSLEWYRQKRRLEAQRRAAEATIREQAALIEKAQDAILLEDLQGRLRYANSSARRLYAWNAAEGQATDLQAQTTAGSQEELMAARRAARETGEWLGELHPTARDGRQLTVASRCTLIRNEQNEPQSLLFINTDVTEKKRLELEFFRAQRIESVGALAGGMAHDLNNALAPVLMGLQLLQPRATDGETRRMLALMEANTRRGADMVRQVLLFSRGRNVDREPLFLGSLMREMERIARATFPKSVDVAALVPDDLLPVLGNATQLHQVLINLCINARDAMPRGGHLTIAADNAELTAAEAAAIPDARPGRFVLLVVSDTGQGMAPDILAHIFEPFFTTKAPGEGTGLGLSTLARIVAQHGGFVNVRSELGVGTTFEVYLPAANLAASAEISQGKTSHWRRGADQVILIVDDELSVREMMSLGLTAQGYRVITAGNGLEAIAVLDQPAAAVRLILLDRDMPGLDGQSAYPLLQARAPAVPIVLMSGTVQAGGAVPAGATLAKPFQLDDLLQTVDRILHGPAAP